MSIQHALWIAVESMRGVKFPEPEVSEARELLGRLRSFVGDARSIVLLDEMIQDARSAQRDTVDLEAARERAIATARVQFMSAPFY